MSSTPNVSARAEAIVADSRAYLARKRTANLDAFASFSSVVAAPLLADSGLDAKTRATVLDLASKIAGTYSRYQAAKADGLLDAVAEVGKPKAKRPTAPKPTAPKTSTPVE